MKSLLSVILVGVLAAARVNADCNTHSSSADCCADTTNGCVWIPTCTDTDKRCTGDASTDCPGEESDAEDCADTCLIHGTAAECCQDTATCVWFAECTSGGSDPTCLDKDDSDTCTEISVEPCSATTTTSSTTSTTATTTTTASVDCSTGESLSECCDINGCSWITCDGDEEICKETVDLDNDCSDQTAEICPDEENGGNILNVAISTLMLSLMSVKLLL